MPPNNDSIEQLEEAVKNAIYVIYELDTEHRKVDARLLSDQQEKQRIFEDPEIQDVLRNLIIRKYAKELEKSHSEKTYQNYLWSEFHRLIHELDVESEGIGEE